MKIYEYKNRNTMSFHPNWVALSTVEIPWKNFVKQSEVCDTSSKSENTYSSSLNFDGIEAKNIYDDIVGKNSKSSEDKIVKSKFEKTNKFTNNNNNNNNNLTLKNVSTNSILKAIEQNDYCFLKKHLNSDNVDSSDDFGWTPLMSAAYNGNIEIVEYLLKLGVDRRVKEKSGLTAAQLALKRNHLKVVALLKRKNITGNKDGDVKDKGINLSMRKREDELDKKLKTNENDVNNDDNIEEFYCEICKYSFKKCSVKKHESSTIHIFNSKPKLRSVAYGIAKQNKGYQMLLNTGWEEENGLGPFGEGNKYPVKTILKRDRKGLGLIDDKEARVTHFKAGDISAINSTRIVGQKSLKKKDREKLLNREAMKDRMIRIALS